MRECAAAAGFSPIISKARNVNSLCLRLTAVSLAVGIFLSGCAHRNVAPVSDTVPVVTTTTILVDLVRAIGGNHVSVRSIVPIGASVESYEPTPQDVAAVHDARLLVENGAGLELWLGALIENAKANKLKTIVASDGIPLIDHNPHLWMDPVLVQAYVKRIRDGLIAVDPAHAKDYRANAGRYLDKLQTLTASIQQQVDTIPKARRLMLVYHDAWRYYGRRFGLGIAGVIEVAPGREPGAGQIAKLVDLARASQISVVFSEPEESSRLADALASSLPNGRVIPLPVDTLGSTPGVASYVQLMRHDTDEIVSALK